MNMKQNNDDWLRALRSKVDDAQMPSEHDADAFEALMARVSASAETSVTAAPRRGRTLRRVAALAAAAVLAGVALLVVRPMDDKEDAGQPLADNTTVVDKSISTEIYTPVEVHPLIVSIEADDRPPEEPTVTASQPEAAFLLAQAAPSHWTSTHKAAADKAVTGSATADKAAGGEDAPSSEAASSPSEATSTSQSADGHAGQEAAHHSSAQQLITPTKSVSSYAAVDEALMGMLAGYEPLGGDWRVMLTATGGGANAGTVVPTFAIPYTSSEIPNPSALLAAPTRRGAKPELDGALTSYDYDACTFVHRVPVRYKLLALYDVWNLPHLLDVSVGSGLLYTELSSTVYPLFINTTYVQRLRMLGIPLEGDVSVRLGERWQVYAGVGITGEYCFSAMLDTQKQPERKFHFGAYEQVGIGLMVADDFRLGFACEYTQTFTPTVLKTLRNNPATLGVNLSLTYLLR